jgi:hypothetical protein
METDSSQNSNLSLCDWHIYTNVQQEISFSSIKKEMQSVYTAIF